MNADTHVEFGWKDADPTEAHAYLLPRLLEQLNTAFGNTKISVLDIGCGNGFVCGELAKLGHSIVGVDSSQDGLEIARAKYQGIPFYHVSIYENDFPARLEREFDCVVSLEVIEHLMFPLNLMKKSRAALKRGGILIISTPYHGYMKNLVISFTNGWDKHWGVQNDGGHIKFFSIKTLRKMALSTGFTPIAFFGAGRFPGFWKSMFMVAQK